MALPSSKRDREYGKFEEDASGNVAVRTTATLSGDINVDSTSVSTSGYVGKASGTNADFITAYASGTTLTCTTLPSGVTAIKADDIVSIVQVATGGGVTETYTRDDAVMTAAGTDPTTITVTGATFAASDTFVVYTNIQRDIAVALDEFPVAAAITDNFANPTTTNVMAMGMAWDGAAWDRMLGDSTDGLLVNLGTNNTVTKAPTSLASTTALAASLVAKGSAGTLYGVSGINNSASAQYIQVHNTSSLPADTAVPVVVIKVDAGENFFYAPESPVTMSTGITISNSSTLATKTIGSADCWIQVEYL